MYYEVKKSKGIMTLAGESSGQIHKLSQSISDTTNTFKNFETKIIESGKNISKINEITGLINSISEQINLLALNAAIEAARAGSHRINLKRYESGFSNFIWRSHFCYF